MKKKMILLMVTAGLLLMAFTGCQESGAEPASEAPAVRETRAAQASATVPADGNAGDVTCKGSYTAEADARQVVAQVEDRELTNGMLQAFYWAEAAAYRRGGQDVKPDFDLPLDTQACPLDESTASWQQYFLKRALNTWHSAQALVLRSENEKLQTEEAYKPNPKTHADNVAGKPATKFLYGYQEYFEPNTMHQAYLEGIPDMLEDLARDKGYASLAAMAEEAFGTSEDDLKAWAELYNRGYMYLTFLGYDLAPGEEEVEAWFDEHQEEYAREGVTRSGENDVDIRQILVSSQEEAEAVLEAWEKDPKTNEAAFAELAVRHSMDQGSALDGGAYHQLKKGQLPAALEDWCFDPARQPGQVITISTEQGVHILYFSGSTPQWSARARADLTARLLKEQIVKAREQYPMKVRYESIGLNAADAGISGDDILYPDIAHERFPEAPVYLQQDYPYTMYGGFLIRTHGCGITTLSMLSTYMTDTPLTPPTMCDRYGKYCHSNGTDGMIFVKEPREMGYYFRERVFEPDQALAALEEGYPVVCIQHKGYWTGGGHYLLLEELTEDGLVRVRDSNIANYGKLDGHKVDKFEWKYIPPKCGGFWVFEKKIVSIPGCVRCGDPESVTEGATPEDYLCHICAKAEIRRNAYLDGCGA